MLEYNIKRNPLIIKEYGRNVQKMIEQAMTIEDEVKRTEAAKAIIRIMAQLNPDVKDNPDQLKNHKDSVDYWRKLWDHLFIMSDYKLNVTAPFPKPSAEKGEVYKELPEYNKSKIIYRTYGKNMERMIEAVSKYPSLERVEMSKILANHLKKLYLLYNRDSVDDLLIVQQLKEMSNGRLVLPDDFEMTSTKEILKSAPLVKSSIKSKKSRKKKKKKETTL